MKRNTVSVAEARKSFSDLLGRVAYAKETITICRRGKPMAKLVPITAEKPAPHPADVRGWLDEDDAFFATLNAIRIRRQ
jgi:prevent-host-death family protein